MMRALAIQLGRVGDVIQTTPLLADLAAHGDEIDVLILRSTHAAILGCPSIKSIITVADTLKPLDDAIAFGFPHQKIPAGAFDLLADLRLPLYDRVINASHAPLGCWLAAEIPFANLDARYGGIIRDRECLYFGARKRLRGRPARLPRLPSNPSRFAHLQRTRRPIASRSICHRIRWACGEHDAEAPQDFCDRTSIGTW
jgi:hypothetical protein